MSRQALFPGFAPAAATDRLFLAIFPDRDTAADLAAFAAAQCAAHGLRGQTQSPERLHVTLFHLDDTVGLRQDVVDAASVAASRVKAAPFDMCFDEVGSFDTRSASLPFVLRAPRGSAPVRAFHAALAQELCKTGLGRFTTASFMPHVTLAYDARMIAAQTVAPVVWRAREFTLIHSLLGRTRHIPLARWPLG